MKLILFICVLCTFSSNNNKLDERQDMEVMEDIFLSLVVNLYSSKIRFPPPNEKNNKPFSEVKHTAIDTIVSDTIDFAFYKNIARKKYNALLKKYDTEMIFNVLSYDNQLGTIDIKEIKKKGRYCIINNTNNNTIKYRIAMSKIMFSTNKKMGSFFFYTHCGNECGSCFFVIVAKSKDKWKIHKQLLLSVS
jgi:hypothetical protein